ncbi:MAG: M15 family metallopeptidase [Lachnospiraceae bacterium]|nr:M15 family metallopeptidase [Lachnospiraceae bacterium]
MGSAPYVRKTAAAIFAILVFVIFSSFTVNASKADTEEQKDETVTLIDDDGNSFEVEKADESNIRAILEGSKDAARKLDEEENRKGDGSIRIYDDETGLKDAAFEDDWSLILINKEHLIPPDYRFELSTIKGNIKSDVRVVEHVNALLKAAEEDGVDIFICSPYRDEEKQQDLFEKKVAAYERQGFDHDEAYDMASESIAIPGTSEHQAGLAFDFVTPRYQRLDEGFGQTEAGIWLKDNAPDYGFILRYPKGKSDITDIEYEPWHYRYVGAKAAREITDLNLTLEEYDKMIGLVD